MSQVSADARVRLSPARAREVAARSAPFRLRAPAHVRDLRWHWRFDPDGDGTQVVMIITYAAGPAWLRMLAHEPTQWWLRRQAAGRVRALARSCWQAWATSVP